MDRRIKEDKMRGTKKEKETRNTRKITGAAERAGGEREERGRRRRRTIAHGRGEVSRLKL